MEKVRKDEVYLKIPSGLTQDDFNEIVQYFKKNGARFDAKRKQWHIRPELQEKFADFIPGPDGKVSGGKYKKANYIFHAYTAGPDPEKFVFFENDLKKAHSFLIKKNQEREPDKAYTTYTIGIYHSETDNYSADEFKFYVDPLKMIRQQYLQIPLGLGKEEFKDTIRFLKQNGALFDPEQKKWYVFADQAEKFKDFLPSEEPKKKEEPEKKEEKKVQRYIVTEEEYADMSTGELRAASKAGIEYITDTEYLMDAQRKAQLWVEEMEMTHPMLLTREKKETVSVSLITGETLTFDRNEIQKEAIDRTMHSTTSVSFDDVLGSKIEEHLNLIAGDTTDWKNGYDIGLSKEPNDNKCTVYKFSGEIIELRGEKFGVHFPDMKPFEITRLVNEYMLLIAENKDPEEAAASIRAENGDLTVGEKVTLNVPIFTKEFEVSGVETVSGILRAMDEEKHIYTLETEEGLREIKAPFFYDQGQTDWIEKAVKAGMSPEQINMIGYKGALASAQMGVIYKSFRDGMHIFQVALYADSSNDAWKMNTFRCGMKNGLPFDYIADKMPEFSDQYIWDVSQDWVSELAKKHQNRLIRDLKSHNITPEKRLVDKIGQLNVNTGRINTVQDILEQDSHRYAEVKKELVTLLKKQEAALMKAPGNDLFPVP